MIFVHTVVRYNDIREPLSPTCSYLGYYHAAVGSYWYHGGECGGCEGTDLSNSTGLNGEAERVKGRE